MSFAQPGTVLLVDDDDDLREAADQSLVLAGLRTESFASARELLRRVRADFNGVVVSDLRMPELDGLQLFKAVQAIDASIPFILITGHGDVPTAVAALRDGVDDFITKPFASDHLVASVQRGLDRRRLELDNRSLRALVASAAAGGGPPLVGDTPAMVRLREEIAAIAATGAHVMIEGESGVGKELVATMIHRRSARRAHGFVNVNCSLLPAGAAAARLLDGARGEPALFDLADRGTLFLDRVEELDPVAQERLVRAVEDQEIVQDGGRTRKTVDVRVVATLLEGGRAGGGLRRDLRYALEVARLRIPPLRERRADIPLLFAHFVEEASDRLHRPPGRLTDAIRQRLLEHDWPGNVRELRAFAFRTVTGADRDVADAADDAQLTLPQRIDRFESSVIRATLEQVRGSAAEAMSVLGLPRKTFYDKLQRHGIDIGRYRRR